MDTPRSELAEQVVEAAIEYRRAEALAARDPLTQAEAQLALDAAIEKAARSENSLRRAHSEHQAGIRRLLNESA